MVNFLVKDGIDVSIEWFVNSHHAHENSEDYFVPKNWLRRWF